MKKWSFYICCLVIFSIICFSFLSINTNAVTPYTNLNGSYPAVSYNSIWHYNASTYSSWRMSDGANFWHNAGKVNLEQKSFNTYKLNTGQTAYVDVRFESSDYSDGFGGAGNWFSGMYAKPCTDRTRNNCQARIYLNDYVMWNTYTGRYFSSAEIQYTISHELGHALGLGDNPYPGNIMTQGRLSNRYFGRDDNDSYERRWGSGSFWGGGY